MAFLRGVLFSVSFAYWFPTNLPSNIGIWLENRKRETPGGGYRITRSMKHGLMSVESCKKQNRCQSKSGNGGAEGCDGNSRQTLHPSNKHFLWIPEVFHTHHIWHDVVRIFFNISVSSKGRNWFLLTLGPRLLPLSLLQMVGSWEGRGLLTVFLAILINRWYSA